MAATNPQGGGAFSTSADCIPTGTWDFTSATVLGISQTGGTFTNATLSGTTTIGAGATLTTPALGAATATSVTATGALKSTGTTGVGYATGAGGTVTQITSSSTGVTLSKICGTIVTVALTTAAGAHEVFTVTNTLVALTDVIVLSTTYVGGGSHGTPVLCANHVTAGTFDIIIANVDAANALNAAMTINFAVVKAVAA
jgi:hypothetical protein